MSLKYHKKTDKLPSVLDNSVLIQDSFTSKITASLGCHDDRVVWTHTTNMKKKDMVTATLWRRRNLSWTGSNQKEIEYIINYYDT